MDTSSSTRAQIIRLNETRLRVWEEGKHLLDSVRGREMTGEQRAKWDRINDHITEIDADVRKLSEHDVREQESNALRQAHANILDGRGAYGDTENDHLRNFLRGDPTAGQRTDMGHHVFRLPTPYAMQQKHHERYGGSPAESRALYWDTGSAGSTVPVLMANTLYEYLEAQVALLKMPTTKITTSTGSPLQFPTLASHSIGTQVIAQGTALAGTDPVFARVALDAYKYGQIVTVASEVLTDSAIDIGAWLMRDIGRGLGRVIDTDLTVGTGTAEPRGVMTAINGNGAGSVTTGGSLIGPTYEKLVDLVYTVADSYRSGGNACWLMRDSTAGNIRKLRSDGAGTGVPLWQPSLMNGIQGGQPDMLLGYPVYTDPNVASLASNARIAAFGDFSAYYVRTVGSAELEMDRSVFFDNDTVAVRGKWRIDGDLLDYGAIASMVQNV